MLLLLDAPADTFSYMVAGYAVIFGVILIYLVSLVIRHRNLHRDLDILEKLEDDKENKG